MKTKARSNKTKRDERQKGSAYIVALLALLVLSIVGLALALITQTEQQAGSNERSINRVFYSADSGISAATARAIVDEKYSKYTYDLTEPATALLVKDQISLSPFYLILDAPCNLCQVNNSGTYRAHVYRQADYAITSTASRLLGSSGAVGAQKTVAAIVEIQPREITTDAYRQIQQGVTAGSIRF